MIIYTIITFIHYNSSDFVIFEIFQRDFEFISEIYPFNIDICMYRMHAINEISDNL